MKENPFVTVSTDVMGIKANPVEVQRLYQEAGFRCDLELLAMPFQYQWLKKLSRGHQVNFDLGGIHGQLGAPQTYKGYNKGLIDWLKIQSADLLLPKIMGMKESLPVLPAGIRVDMIGMFLHKPIYCNVHNNIVAAEYDRYLEYAKHALYSHLTIENGGDPQDIAAIVDLINKFRDDGADLVTGTFDLVHAMVAQTGGNFDISDVKKHWHTVLKQITPEFTLMHLPIGLNADSLPIQGMLEEKSMLRDLGDVIYSLGIHITLENQHSLLTGANRKIETERLKHIREGFEETVFAPIII